MADIEPIEQELSSFPTPPSPATDPDNFDAVSEPFFNQFSTFTTEANTAIDEINTAITGMNSQYDDIYNNLPDAGGYSQAYIDNLSSTLSYTFASDADATLTATENQYAYITINDGVITADKNLIVDSRQRKITVSNNNTYNVTVKTSVGTGIVVLANTIKNVYNDGINVIDDTETKTFKSISNLLHLQDQKADTIAGGDFISGTWRDRDLNTVITNNIVGASLNPITGVITLPAGLYEIEASSPALSVGSHQTKLYNIDDLTDLVFGTSEFSSTVDLTSNRSFIDDTFELLAEKDVHIQHQCQSTRVTKGFGDASSFTVGYNLYTDCKIWKVG